MRESAVFTISNLVVFKKQLQKWCSHFSKYCILDSNQWNGNQNELIAAVGSVNEISPEQNSFDILQKFHDEKKDWLFGYLSYDLKNEIEKLSSENFDGIKLPRMQFFQPEYVFIFSASILRIEFLSSLSSEERVKEIFQEIINLQYLESSIDLPLSIKGRISKPEYIQTIDRIKDHIRLGDIYEMNYCMEFFSDDAKIDPADIFLKLNETSEAPYSAFLRADDKYILCASPERFLKKSGKEITSQPIKGTAKRGSTISEDIEIKKMLGENAKEKSENVMIVDIVRNDLAKSCNDVTVEELFGVYTFKQWHQMISTVSGTLRDDMNFADAIKNSFPMGSMTGAPKVRAMQLIEQYEKTKRGIYSGAVGYIAPNGDFDLNVVIRGIIYNQPANYLSFQVGSAITAGSVPENEYEECLLKAKGMFEALHISKNLHRKENADA